VNPLEAALRRVRDDLARIGVPWAVIGGLAVSVRSEPRTTRDIDVAVDLDAQQEDRLVRELLGRGYRQIEQGTFWQTSVDRLATLRLQSPIETTSLGVLVDLMFASSGIEAEVVTGAEAIAVLPGLSVPVVRHGHLIALKFLADRLQDRADLEKLLDAATPADLLEAKDALALIASRGFHRGRDLTRDFGELLAGRGEA
jgi:hypothetical protein